MNNIHKAILLVCLLIVFSVGVIAELNSDGDDTQASGSPVVTDLSNGTGHVVNKLESCTDEKYTEQTPILGNCSHNPSVCNPDNTSCVMAPETYSCIIGYDTVEKNLRKCKTDGYEIGMNKLNTGEYVCNVDDTSGSTTVICDSKYDGNGDGICTSGESCMKFVIRGNVVDQYEKNSKDEFVKDDPTFFLNEITTEVKE